MNKKQLITISAVLAALLFAGAVIILFESFSWKSDTSVQGRKVLKDYDVNKISRIKIKNANSFMNLQKKDGRWCINENASYPADFNLIKTLIDNVWNMKMAQKMKKVKKDALQKLDLESPAVRGSQAGTLVEFYEADKKEPVAALIFGKQHFPQTKEDANPFFAQRTPDGRYVIIADKPDTVYLIAAPFEIVQPNIQLWRSKDFCKPENVSAVSESAGSSKLWGFSKKNPSDSFTLENAKKGEAADESLLNTFPMMLSACNILDVLPISKAAESGMDNPDHIINITTFDDFSYVYKISKKDDKYFMKFEVSFNPKSSVDKVFDKAVEKAAGQKTSSAAPSDNTPLKASELKAKFEREKIFSGWIYQIPDSFVKSVIKNRNELLTKKAAEPEQPHKAAQEPAKSKTKKKK